MIFDIGDTIKMNKHKGFITNHIRGIGDINTTSWVRMSNFNEKYKKYSESSNLIVEYSKVVLIEKLCDVFTYKSGSDEYLDIF